MKTLLALLAVLFVCNTANAQFPIVPMVPVPNVQYSEPPIYYYYTAPPQVYYAPMSIYPQYGTSLFVNGLSVNRTRRPYIVTMPINVSFSDIVYYDYPRVLFK